MLFLIPGIKTLLKGKSPKSLHALSVKTISGQLIPLAQFKGKKLLIVNTASKCGLTPQYSGLQWLHEKYSNKNLVVLAFPCNDFAGQEPDKEDVITQFCKANFGLSFELMEKLHVKGPQQHPLYAWLCNKTQNGVMNSSVLWNFQKYLINEQGHLVDVMGPWSKPFSKKMINWLEN
jgi:glutathione peroxidase